MHELDPSRRIFTTNPDDMELERFLMCCLASNNARGRILMQLVVTRVYDWADSPCSPYRIIRCDAGMPLSIAYDTLPPTYF